jgi:hypothetical protein
VYEVSFLIVTPNSVTNHNYDFTTGGTRTQSTMESLDNIMSAIVDTNSPVVVVTLED